MHGKKNHARRKRGENAEKRRRRHAAITEVVENGQLFTSKRHHLNIWNCATKHTQGGKILVGGNCSTHSCERSGGDKRCGAAHGLTAPPRPVFRGRLLFRPLRRGPRAAPRGRPPPRPPPPQPPPSRPPPPRPPPPRRPPLRH
jgi:hypothetical protein